MTVSKMAKHSAAYHLEVSSCGCLLQKYYRVLGTNTVKWHNQKILWHFMKQRKWSLTTDVKMRKRKYIRSPSNYYMYIWSNKSLFPMNGWPSRLNELMFRANGWPSHLNELVFRANGWPSRSNGLVFRANGWPSRLNELVFRANGWTSCSNELVFQSNGWPSRLNGLVFRANGWPSCSNGCKFFSNGLQTVVNGILLKNGKLLEYIFPCIVTIALIQTYTDSYFIL